MRIVFLLLLIHLNTITTFGQVIRGRVLDQKTREPVDFASVFFNGTFLGTTTDVDGAFELDVTPYANRTLQISAMGYHTSSLYSLEAGEHYEVILKRALYEISEVSIESKSLTKKRKSCMRIFKDEFLGLTKNAGDCHILNEEDITFNYHSDRDTLRAIARKPLVILNNSLGYQITYYLDKFEFDRIHKTTAFSGNIIFNMDMATNKAAREKFEERRIRAYTGSCKHFFSALWENNLSEEGFKVQEERSMQPVGYHEIVIELNGKKYFSYHKELELIYNHFRSTVAFRGPMAHFASDGFFEPEAIQWYGTMSMDRIADWLPYEYSPF
ncbi:MAG: carboxypeptidase-like regulatory domain-containing protein [Bacteroidales bacterium]